MEDALSVPFIVSWWEIKYWAEEIVFCGFSLSTEPPKVERNLTSDQRRVHSRNHSVWRKNVVWTWREKTLISSNKRWAISLFNVSCGVAMINVCLWSKNRAANHFRVSLRASSPSRARTREPLRTRASRVSTFDDIFQAGWLRVDEVRTAGCFSVLPLLHISEFTQRDGRKKRTAKHLHVKNVTGLLLACFLFKNWFHPFFKKLWK